MKSDMLNPPVTRSEAERIIETGEFAGGDCGEQYMALYEFYLDSGQMPYEVAKARRGDPYTWIINQLVNELGA